jgi:hypothetical protein
MKTISLEQLHGILSDAFAVCVNDTLYFVGYDNDDIPYIADNDGQDLVSFEEVDGYISVTDRGLFFFVAEQPIMMKILHVSNLQELLDKQ